MKMTGTQIGIIAGTIVLVGGVITAMVLMNKKPKVTEPSGTGSTSPQTASTPKTKLSANDILNLANSGLNLANTLVAKNLQNNA